jgi:hypothetical protein
VVTASEPGTGNSADRAPRPALRLSWLDVLLVALMTLVALALGQISVDNLPFISKEKIPPSVVFELRNGIVGAQNNISQLQARLRKVQDRIATEYADAAIGATSQQSGQAPPPGSPTSAPQSPLPALRSESEALTKALERSQLSLADIQQAAAEQREDELKAQMWRDNAVIAAASAVSLLGLMLIIAVVRLLFRPPISPAPVCVGSTVATLLMLLALIISWLAAVGVAAVGLLILVATQRNSP